MKPCLLLYLNQQVTPKHIYFRNIYFAGFSSPLRGEDQGGGED